MKLRFLPLIIILLSGIGANAQVCDDLITSGCETFIQDNWKKVSICVGGEISIQYCHPKFYIGSGHNLTLKGGSFGKIVFDELLDKTTLKSGLKARKAVGKNSSGGSFTGIFLYNKDGDIESCFVKSGADRSKEVTIPRE